MRATGATLLYQLGFDEQLIAEHTKHRSTGGLRSYKRTSTVQQIEVADALAIPDSQEKPKDNVTVEMDTSSVETTAAKPVLATATAVAIDTVPTGQQIIVSEAQKSQPTVINVTNNIRFCVVS